MIGYHSHHYFMLYDTIDFKKGRLSSVGQLNPESSLEAKSFLWLVTEEEGRVTLADWSRRKQMSV